MLVAVAVAATLVGAAIAISAILLLDRDDRPQHRYEVAVFLDQDISDEQKDAVESALAAVDPVDGIRFETREEAWQRFQELFRDRPDLLAAVRQDHLPESFRLSTTGESFDCQAMSPVWQLAGVADISVVEPASDGAPGTSVHCPWE